MSVLIKGMKMPKNCDACPMLYEYRFCELTDDRASSIEWKTEEKRMPKCPLIELPDHGDLIDRDELHHNMKADAINKLSFFDDGYLHYLKGLEAVEDMLNGAPVIIPAERSEEWEFTSET